MLLDESSIEAVLIVALVMKYVDLLAFCANTSIRLKRRESQSCCGVISLRLDELLMSSNCDGDGAGLVLQQVTLGVTQ
jgi:hypothetical protein